MKMRALVFILFGIFGVSFCKQRTTQPTAESRSSEDQGSEIAERESTLVRTLKEKELTTDCPAGKVCLTVLQLNDVYEINAIAGGKAGGLDRVARLRQLLSENIKAGPVVTMMAGDFLYPSALGTIKENGRPWVGKQMTSVLKTTGLDFTMFGNHEFDLDGPDFFDRLEETGDPANPLFDKCDASGAGLVAVNYSLATPEDNKKWEDGEEKSVRLGKSMRPGKLTKEAIVCSGVGCPRGAGAALAGDVDLCAPEGYVAWHAPSKCFRWIASNVFAVDGKVKDSKTVDPRKEKPFTVKGQPIPRARILSFENGGQKFNVGLVALTIIKNQKDYQQFAEVQSTASMFAKQLKDGVDGLPKADAVFALTHLNRKDDINLLQAIPDIDMTIGGHDHKNSFDCVDHAGRKHCVAKADANARTVYIHRVIFDPQAHTAAAKLAIRSELLPIDENMPSDPKVADLINCWFAKADAALAKESGGGGLSLKTPIASIPGEPLDGGEESVRNKKGSNLTLFISKTMLESANKGRSGGDLAKFAFISGGSIRIDDVLGPGVVTYFDAIRVFPSTHKLVNARIKLANLAKMFRRLWGDVPPGAGATFHLYPKVASSDLEPKAITEAQIQKELMEKAGVSDPNAEIIVHSTDYLLRLNDNLTDVEKSYFTLLEDQFELADTRALFVSGLKEYFPL